MPTAHAAPPLKGQIIDGDLPPVWPDAEGKVRGVTFEPLHKAAPKAARKDPALYELLALIDAVRDGRCASANWQNRGVQELIGHQSLAMTQRSFHFSPAALDATIRLLENRATARAVGDSLETPKGELLNVNG